MTRNIFSVFVTSISQFPLGESTKFTDHPLDGITLIDLGSLWVSRGIFLALQAALLSHSLWPQLGFTSALHTLPSLVSK